MVETSESAAAARAAHVALDPAPLIAIAGAAWVQMGLGQPSDDLLMPIARAIHSFSPPADLPDATPD